MELLEILLEEGKISKINELETERYVNFFENSYRDNLEHCKDNITAFPRWSIISGYYAMHDITKLLIAKKSGLKIDDEIHATTIKVLRELINDMEIMTLIERGYNEFISLANDLKEARKQRTKAQYYTGTAFMRERFQKMSAEFLSDIVAPYIRKIRELIDGRKEVHEQ